MRLGIVGCGTVFERLHLPAIASSEDWELAAASDPDGDRRAWLRRTLPDAAVHGSLQELADAASVDAVMILAPARTHARLATDALRRGLPTFVEKPLAVDVAGALEVARVADAGRVPLLVGFNRRMRSTYRELRRAVAARGRPRDVSYRFLADGRAWPSHWERPEDEALHEVASHGADLLPWLLDTAARRVRARREQAGVVSLDIETAAGVRARVVAGVARRYEERLAATWPSATLEVHPNGLLETTRVPGPLRGACRRAHGVACAVARRVRRRPGLTEESLRRQLRAFAARVRSGPEIRGAGVEAGVRAARVVAAASRSLEADGAWRPVHDPALTSNGEETR